MKNRYRQVKTLTYVSTGNPYTVSPVTATPGEALTAPDAVPDVSVAAKRFSGVVGSSHI